MGKDQPSGTCTPMRCVTYELIDEQEHCLERKFAIAKIEEVFKGRAKEIDNHRIVVAFGTEPPDERDADAASKRLVYLRLGGSGCLLHDPVIFLLLRSRPETLPGERTMEEVHEEVSRRSEIVTMSLFNTKVGVDGSVTCSTGQALVLSGGNVKVGPRVPVLLGETEANDVDLVLALADSHQEVFRFDVTILRKMWQWRDENPTREWSQASTLGSVSCLLHPV